jgi:hypothetical protein
MKFSLDVLLKWLHAASALAIIAFMVAATAVLLQINARIDHSAQSLDQVSANLNSYIDPKNPRGFSGVLANTNAVLVQLGLSADEWRRASLNQREYWDKSAKDAAAAVAKANVVLTDLHDTMLSTRSLIEHSDHNINSELLPKLSAVLEQSGRNLQVLTDQTNQNMKVLQSILEHSDQLARDENVKKMVAELAGSTEELHKGTAEVAETMGYIRDMFKPTKASFWHNLTSQAIPTALRVLIPGATRVTNTPTVKTVQ